MKGIIKRYKYRGNDAKLIHQNHGEVLDVIEGVLLDNLFIETKRGYMLLLETYENTWTSLYTIVFSTNCDDLEAIWEGLKSKVE